MPHRLGPAGPARRRTFVGAIGPSRRQPEAKRRKEQIVKWGSRFAHHARFAHHVCASCSVFAYRSDLLILGQVGGRRKYPEPIGGLSSANWCCWRGLNSRPLPYQGSALPLSYSSARGDQAAPFLASGGGGCNPENRREDRQAAADRMGDLPGIAAFAVACCWRSCSAAFAAEVLRDAFGGAALLAGRCPSLEAGGFGGGLHGFPGEFDQVGGFVSVIGRGGLQRRVRGRGQASLSELVQLAASLWASRLRLTALPRKRIFWFSERSGAAAALSASSAWKPKPMMSVARWSSSSV